MRRTGALACCSGETGKQARRLFYGGNGETGKQARRLFYGGNGGNRPDACWEHLRESKNTFFTAKPLFPVAYCLLPVA
ncbi:MAG: hypothetical protein SXA11_04405 [Cyanobacteriota bacterium]|nr:hypothetical protein [Cyanobacteriota bacterium]